MDFLPDALVHHLRRAAAEPDLTGTRYTLQHQLGRGGLGTVWAVQDRDLDRTVALKVMDDDRADAPLLEEARTAARLQHPGIVPIHEAGLLADGRPFYVMKLIEGQRLDQVTAALPARLRIFLKICDAVAYAHSRHVLHRDLKPQNIMVGPFGEVFVLDWGLAGTGTPGYMPPEQTRGEPLDARADVHALGAILRGFAGPAPIAAIAERALAPDPQHRYASVAALAADVTRYLDHQPVTAYRERPWERVQRFAAANPVLLVLLAAYVAVRFALFFLQRW